MAAMGVEKKKKTDEETAEDNKTTIRNDLAQIYRRLLAAHESYVKANYRLLTYGMKEGSATHQKSYPDTFARMFFRYVKALSNKKGDSMAFN